ncbi:MAG: RimK family alpha-L-glutamate ligase [Armatimonadota bacterium]
MSPCAIVNAGPGAWAFEEIAGRLSRVLWLEVASEPAERSYLLGWDDPDPPETELFIPFQAVVLASDKRLQAELFRRHGIACPRTELLPSPAEVERFLRRETGSPWVLKYPTGCGASGHRLIGAGDPVPADWPRPYVLQELVRMERPEVYRQYGAGGETFGWNVRRFPAGARPSPWVAHARGARYELPGDAPPEAEELARQTLQAAGLLDSFGCVDLLRNEAGRWLVLEVGTDGVFNHVDRDLGLPREEAELDQRLAEAFWSGSSRKPWGSGPYRPRAA